jgi:hypothetical protein
VRSIRTKRRLLGLVLPLLLLRLLVPAGFMPFSDGGSFGVALCPGEAALPPGLAAHVGHAMHHAGHPGRGQPTAEHHALCLFAASAVPPVPAAALLASAARAALAAAALPAQARSIALPVILRAQSARAPPETSKA